VSSRRGRRHAAAALGRRFATIVGFALLLGLPAPATAEPLQQRPRGTSGLLNPYEQQLLELVNEARARHGRQRVVASRGLTAAAELHTERMVRRGFFEHEAPGEPNFWRRIERFYPSRGYDYWAVGENLVYGQPSLEPEEALREWLASPSHRRSVLSAQWREAGLAVRHASVAPGEFEGDPVTVVTLDLGVRRG
jgi:uncharacterized protein YkwD